MTRRCWSAAPGSANAASDTLAQGDHEVLDVRAHLPVGSLEIAEPEIVGGLPVMLQGGGEALNFQM